MNYWSNREDLRQKAVKHTEKMREKYMDEIAECISDSTIYFVSPQGKSYKMTRAEAVVEKSDSVSAIFKHCNEAPKKCAVLNFASYKNPGGKFIDGSSAQEEALCHSSFLYNVLSSEKFVKNYYEQNRASLNRALYLDRAIYSPNVLFEKDGKTIFTNVITCAAPNWGAASSYGRVTREENTHVLKSRINMVVSIAEQQGVDILIAGAYGCGVFKQDPFEVAEIFRKRLGATSIKKVIFPIPDNRNLAVFRNVLA